MEKAAILIKKGQSIESFIENISEIFPAIKEFNFIIYKPSGGVEKRISKNAISKNTFFGENKWSFEKQLIKDFDRQGTQKTKIEKLLFHDIKEPSRLIPINKNEVSNWVRDTKKLISPNEAIGLVSKVATSDGQIKHIPLMDFSCPPNTNYQNFVTEALVLIGQKRGILVNSGRSFHFYGFDLQTPIEWQQFMSYCILLSPFTDVRYIGHRLISGYCILRIGENKIKPHKPEIIHIMQ
jgi:hypothetical protein